MSRTVLVSGGSGLIGSALTAHLRARGDRVISLVRREALSHDEIRWDPAAGSLPEGAVDGSDVVVNLSGAGIGDKRWSEHRKQTIFESRLAATGLLARAVASASNPPSIFLSASAIGIYGQDRGDEVLDESAGVGHDFLARVSAQWELAAQPAAEAGTRVVLFRTGLVLDGRGGLLGPLLPLFKAGLGGKIGSGGQWMSWISLDDEIAALDHLMDSSIFGPVNLVAPNPVTNKEFTLALSRALRRPALLTVPRWALVLRFGREMAEGMALANQRVTSGRLTSDGFHFGHPDLEPALRRVLDRG
ncbi:MAG: TIGR01777 family oxidoreductase [Acidimicrobiia bacterium]|nr:TIGR01777 family oxidoreductase [Acidimicrobiia bacterium]